MFCPSLCLCTRLTSHFDAFVKQKLHQNPQILERTCIHPDEHYCCRWNFYEIVSHGDNFSDFQLLRRWQILCNDGAIVMYVSNCWCKQCQIWWNSKQFARYVSAIALCATASDLPVFNLVHYGSWPRWSSCQLARPIGDEDCRQKTCAILKV